MNTQKYLKIRFPKKIRFQFFFKNIRSFGSSELFWKGIPQTRSGCFKSRVLGIKRRCRLPALVLVEVFRERRDQCMWGPHHADSSECARGSYILCGSEQEAREGI